MTANKRPISQSTAEWIVSLHLSRWVLLTAILIMVVVLGFFLPPVSIILMTAPIILPPLRAANFDLVWFGVIMTIVMELGLIHRPVGLNLFVIKNIAPDISLREVVWGVMPFVVLMILAVIVLCVFPEIATRFADGGRYTAAAGCGADGGVVEDRIRSTQSVNGELVPRMTWKRFMRPSGGSLKFLLLSQLGSICQNQRDTSSARHRDHSTFFVGFVRARRLAMQRRMKDSSRQTRSMCASATTLLQRAMSAATAALNSSVVECLGWLPSLMSRSAID
jgi:hypothetical protein